jgi:hypothetical protein
MAGSLHVGFLGVQGGTLHLRSGWLLAHMGCSDHVEERRSDLQAANIGLLYYRRSSSNSLKR